MWKDDTVVMMMWACDLVTQFNERHLMNYSTGLHWESLVSLPRSLHFPVYFHGDALKTTQQLKVPVGIKSEEKTI